MLWNDNALKLAISASAAEVKRAPLCTESAALSQHCQDADVSSLQYFSWGAGALRNRVLPLYTIHDLSDHAGVSCIKWFMCLL